MANSPLVKESTRKHIQDIAAQYNYQPNTMARAIAKRKSGILGFCLLKRNHTSFSNPFFGPVLDGALEQAYKQGYHFVLAANPGEDHTFDEPFLKDCIEGVILASFTPLNTVNEFKKRKIPLIIINDVLETENNVFIMDENYEGAYSLMSHLIQDRKHKKIAIISDRLSHTSYLLRYFAYIDAHRDFGIDVYTNPLINIGDIYGGHSLTSNYFLKKFGYDSIPLFGSPMVVAGLDPKSAYNCTMDMIRTNNLPSAIFATADTLAYGAINAILDSGLRIPQDIAVVGYDDNSLSKSMRPSLTTVNVNRQEFGRVAVKELVNLIKNPNNESSVVYIKNRLIIRESS